MLYYTQQTRQEIEPKSRDEVIELTYEYMDLCMQYMRLGYDDCFKSKKEFMTFVMQIWIKQQKERG